MSAQSHICCIHCGETYRETPSDNTCAVCGYAPLLDLVGATPEQVHQALKGRRRRGWHVELGVGLLLIAALVVGPLLLTYCRS